MASPHRQKTEIIEQAFQLARRAHGLVRRRSGEPYILHPIAVARIVCKEMGLGSTSICSALLHDVVEDTEYTVEDIRRGFGDKIAQIVDGLTKISGVVFDEHASAQAENFRKLLLTMSSDIRVILIKLADRLHNMRTLSSMLPAKQYKIAGETLYLYAPLAHRLGLFAIKTELENLSFKYEHPREYELINQKLAATEGARNRLFEHFAKPVDEKLQAMGLHYEMRARVKSAFSIWNKMNAKSVPFEDIYDIFAVRIVFEPKEGIDEKNLCWDIYSAITDIYRIRPDRLRDWMGVDRDTFYESGKFAIVPMDFYFPGTGKSGDLPPRKDFADTWHPRLLELMPKLEMTVQPQGRGRAPEPVPCPVTPRAARAWEAWPGGRRSAGARSTRVLMATAGSW